MVEFHFARILSPPFTICPCLTTTSASIGSQMSTREPNRIIPTRSPRATVSPSRFQHSTRRAMAPAICLKTNVALWRMNIDHVLLVFARRGRAKRRVKLPRAIDDVRDASGHRRALHVHVPDRKKNADAMAHRRIEQFIHDFDHMAIGGRNYDSWFGRNLALGIAEEIKNEKPQKNQDSGGPFPARDQTQCARDQGRERKFVRFLNHGDGRGFGSFG